MKIFFTIFSVKKEEIPLLISSVLLLFFVFASYAVIKPIRDALGIDKGTDDLKWLFLGTFIATIIASIAAMYLSSRAKRKNYLNGVYIFFITNLFAFFIAIRLIEKDSAEFIWLSRIFFVWVSVFSLFAISSAWSLLADVFTKDSSKRLFGIISAGVSLGSIVGSFLVGSNGIGYFAKRVFSVEIDISDYMFLSMAFLLIALVIKGFVIKSAFIMRDDKESLRETFEKPIGAKNPFVGFSIVFKSRYLLSVACFILLLTSVSTFLYIEQGRIIDILFHTREEKTAAFADIDFIVNTFSFIIQIFLTSKIAKYIGLKWLLSSLGFVVAIGFVILIFTHPMFLPFVVVMCIRRVGEYALIKPGREMLFVPLDSDSKYKVKSFLDVVVYRGGDSISSQIEGLLSKSGINIVLLGGAFVALAWSILGYYLGRSYEEKSNE